VIILLSIFILTALFYFYFILNVSRGLSRLVYSKATGIAEEFVTVIIPFRNESCSILESLKSITNQSYPADKYEVIYVNDLSEDDSLMKIETSKRPPNIRVISVPEAEELRAHKKRAIQYAIEQAKGEIIVTTDCDCTHGRDWLKSLLSIYDRNTAFVSGPVRFVHRNSLFSRLQSLEFGGLILTGAGLIGLKQPVTCSAACLSYRKSVFMEIGGFKDNMNLSSGDDELIMQKIARETEYDVKFNLNKDCVVSTVPNENHKQFINQRRRWASKGLFYDDKMLIVKLFLIFIFYVTLPLQILQGIFVSNIYLLSFGIIFIIKIIAEYQVLKNGAGLLYEKKLLRLLFIAELFQIPYIIIAGFMGVLGNYSWKNRNVGR